MRSIPDIVRESIGLLQQGRSESAEKLLRTVLLSAPEHPDALHLLGVIEAQRGNLQEAAGLLSRAAAGDGSNPAMFYNLANALRQLGRQEEAVAHYDTALRIGGDNIGALNNRAGTLFDMGRFGDALAGFDRVLAFDRANAGAHSNRGNALLALNRFEDALASYDRALALRSDFTDAHFGRGKALLNLHRPEEALASLARAAAGDPEHAEAHAHLGEAYFQSGRYLEALAAYDKAIGVAPDLAAAHEGRGNALFKLGRGTEAFAAYDRAYALDANLPYLEGTRLLAKLYVCDWRNLDEERRRLASHVVEGKRAANPFAFLNAGSTAEEQLRCAQLYNAARYPAAATPLWRGEIYRHPKIRVGYLCAEFREQATAYLTADLFECHDRTAFEWHAFSTGPDDRSATRKRIEAAFDRFADLRGRSDGEISQRIRAAEIDVLVHLNGYFGDERTGVLAMRPAPIQVNYLGFPGTLGAPYADYILADRWIIPEEDQRFYSEKVVYLPNSYQANDRKKMAAAERPPRAALGLPERSFVFCCFNNAYKITPDVFSVWMRLLAQTPGGVLWLLQVDKGIEANLAREAAARGVAPERIVYAPFVHLREHLARLPLADLFLDTLPVNAHTTASDALWMGVPVLTCAGQTFAARVAASLLSAVGLKELITRSLGEYEALALKLAQDPALLAGLRAKLAQNRDAFPLFDTPRLTRNIESAYATMVERQRLGLPLESFTVFEES